MRRLTISALALVLAAGLWTVGPDSAHAQGLRAVVDSTASRIDYTGSAFLHDWTGTSKSVTGTVVLDPAAPKGSSIDVRPPVISFDSGNNRRDGNMIDVTDAANFPTVRFRSSDVQPLQWGRSNDGYAGTWRVDGALTFHGQTHPLTADVQVRVVGETVRATTQFPVSLTRYGIKRPELAWIAPISDTIRVDAQIVARRSGSSPSDYDVIALTEGNALQSVRSTDVRPILLSTYPGARAGMTAAYQTESDGPPSWTLSIHGFTRSATGLSGPAQMVIRADDKRLQPLRVDTETQTRNDGQVEEIATAVFSRSIFETIATAASVEVVAGNTRFVLSRPTRRDMRLILDRVGPTETSETSSE